MHPVIRRFITYINTTIEVYLKSILHHGDEDTMVCLYPLQADGIFSMAKEYNGVLIYLSKTVDIYGVSMFDKSVNSSRGVPCRVRVR